MDTDPKTFLITFNNHRTPCNHKTFELDKTSPQHIHIIEIRKRNLKLLSDDKPKTAAQKIP